MFYLLKDNKNANFLILFVTTRNMTRVEELHNPFSDLEIFIQIFMTRHLHIRVCDKHGACSH